MSESSSASVQPNTAAEPGDAGQRAVVRAPVASPFAYLGRQPILDRSGALDAYELLFRGGTRNRAEITDEASATAQVVARTIGQIGVQAVLGAHRGYVNIGRELLFDDVVHLLSPDRFVLEVLEHVRLDAPALERIATLRRAGFRIALDDVAERSENLLAALPYVDIVKVDMMLTDRAELPALAAAIRAAGKTLVAEKVETQEDFRLARGLGFDLFQGYFFARPQMLRTRRARSSRAALLRLIALVARDVGVPELEAELRRHPGVIAQLLRLVNSTAYGFARPIASLREAVLAVGTRQIARWAQLLLYATGRDLPWSSDPLVQLAGTRSHFMELAARSVHPHDQPFADAAFMTGIFSLLHVMIGVTPARRMERLGLARPISDAIDRQHGELGALLRIAKAAELGDYDAMQAIVEEQGGRFTALTPSLIGELNLWAASWFSAHSHG
ncbi:EAL and HDOD domain-containing protein [Paraburkholderia caballeronis]|uniref:EAL and HDOD domain-containing protein n=1 Tax=Paraburkholderia caballeronis TaxID=416943 RepID=UPI001064D25C|nr:EAL domain-containing protein [Paraburkholderia caballeronis]TDV11626.1 EAL and modified HD-GYP domain-containing signal transduction protein [Paraburkholderia caballeronis]TDV17367.1 EAL and modified HD-GYP domain-containing signal transduction protein [Paraburkholderia caballeronis]TDV27385.1 EAL and modified HD-GYP domain-containing signal transduction protein [Paraburkholderia caballeronis]